MISESFLGVEYFTSNGFWQVIGSFGNYELECSASKIFEYFKAEYFVKNGYSNDPLDEQKAIVCDRFILFLMTTLINSIIN